MFEEELKELEKAYTDNIEILEKEIMRFMPIFISITEKYIEMIKQRDDLQEKLEVLLDKMEGVHNHE